MLETHHGNFMFDEENVIIFNLVKWCKKVLNFEAYIPYNESVNFEIWCASASYC